MKPKTYEASLIGDMVFGANDGIVTTFAVVAGVAGADLDARIVLIMGLANLVGDGISMAVGNYLGRKSEQEVDQQIQVTKSLQPVNNAIAMFCAFVVAGLVPLVPYMMGVQNGFFLSMFCAGAAMFTVGALRSMVVERRWWSTGSEVLTVGSFAAAAAYFVGFILKNAVS